MKNFIVVHTFYREIEDIVFECKNLELARIKLAFWRNDVLKLAYGKPDHPVLALLQKNAVDIETLQEFLLKIIDGFEQVAVSPHFETFEDVTIHWMRTAGVRELLLMEWVKKENRVSTEILYQMMMLIEMVYHVQHLRLYVRHDLVCFSEDEMNRFGVTREMLQQYVTTDSIKNLLRYQAEKIRKAYAVLESLSRKQRALLSYWVVRCEMAYAVFREIEKSDFRVLEELTVLTPLRCWWIRFRG